MTLSAVLAAAAILAWAWPEPAQAGPEIVTVPTRPGVTVRVLLVADSRPARAEAGALARRHDPE